MIEVNTIMRRLRCPLTARAKNCRLIGVICAFRCADDVAAVAEPTECCAVIGNRSRDTGAWSGGPISATTQSHRRDDHQQRATDRLGARQRSVTKR
jgi:hypothetical protein